VAHKLVQVVHTVEVVKLVHLALFLLLVVAVLYIALLGQLGFPAVAAAVLGMPREWAVPEFRGKVLLAVLLLEHLVVEVGAAVLAL
jgi:hypothetical protein